MSDLASEGNAGLVNWVSLPTLGDERGSLVVVESGKQVPFEFKRVYHIFGTQPGVARGFHAHKTLRQMAVCVAGACTMLLDDGLQRESVLLEGAGKGIMIEAMVWHEMSEFSDDCVMAVFASDYYDESDYIRDYQHFLGLVQT